MNQAPLPISVCLIVKNEAQRLEKSLAPFVGRVAEIIAYDSGSTDATVQILEKHGARVISGPWLGFADTRRAVWSQARENWLLWLDADEFFSAETVDALVRIFREQPQGPAFPAGFRVRRQVIFNGQKVWHGDWDRDWVLRIFRRDNYQMSDRRVHESVTVDGPVVRLPGMVEHDSIRDWPGRQARSLRYAELWAQQALEENVRNRRPFPRALWTFCRGYLIRSGWIDGMLGWNIALLNAREVYTKYQLLAQLKRQKPTLPRERPAGPQSA